MIVAIDAGNSRIKWGVHDGHGWQARGALATADARWIAEAADEWPREARIVLCNVAGAEVAHHVECALAGWRSAILRFRSTAECCGVRNGYAQPAQLGADRWAALVGARGIVAEGGCLVICAGTATTIDRLDADGRFRGGVILPGFDLMRGALAGNTAQLPLAEGEFSTAPDNTMDAIVSGCLSAQLGAIERLYAAACEGGTRVTCLLTGGGADRLLPHLHVPVRHEESLILAGLVRYAESV